MPRLDIDPYDTPIILFSSRSMAENQTGNWRSIRPVLDADKCTNCLLCWKFCPDVCISIEGENPVIDFRYCKGCGICAVECPKKCIAMTEEKNQ